MSSGDRLAVATRAFFLATLLGLTLAFQDAEVLQALVLLVAIGTVASAAGRFSFVAPEWIYLLEGFVSALVIAGTLPDGGILLPYLIVPSLLAGTTASLSAVIVVSGFEVLGVFSVLVLGAGSATMSVGLERASPWAVASLGTGLMASWVAQLRGGPGRNDEASYESARRLLSQLRTVARRLSSGLDPVSLSEQILASVNARLDDTRSALFVRTEGGVLAPLGYRGFEAKQALAPEDYLVDICWAEMEPAHEPQAHGTADTRHRTVLPLRSGSRMIGVVMSDAAEAPTAALLGRLMTELDEQSLRLDTALVFDEVRSLATTEERQRLAREIHDGVAQEVASLGYVVDELTAGAITEAQRTKLTALRAEITRVVNELRLSIFDLRSEVAPGAGLGSALSDHVRAVGARSGLTVHLTLDEAPTRLRSEVETELLRIAQEAVTNARKHSQANNLWVDCRIRPPYARLTVEDDGKGMGQPRPDSYGLRIMRERALRIGAKLDIGPGERAKGTEGTRVTVIVGGESAAANRTNRR